MRLVPGFVLGALILCSGVAPAQTVSALDNDLAKLTDTVSVSGYETAATAYILQQLPGMNATQDAMGNVIVSFGSGAPHRLLAASVDEPGCVVSKIDTDGFLRVQRLPQGGLPVHYNELQNAQPMWVEARSGKLLPGVSAGLSIHLEPGRAAPPDPDDLDNFYIDMGAKNFGQVRDAGVEVLSPIAAERQLVRVGAHDWAATSVGDKFGAAILLQLARALKSSPVHGTITLAFVVQQTVGSRGLRRIVQQQHPDEMIYIGRSRPVARNSALEPAITNTPLPALGSGVWIYDSSIPGPAPSLEKILSRNGETFHHAQAAPFLLRGYGPPVSPPQQTIHLGVPLAWPFTAAETIDERDLIRLQQVLAGYVGLPAFTSDSDKSPVAIPYKKLPPRPSAKPDLGSLLQTLSEVYGVSEHEEMSRHAVEQMLPAWAHPVTDSGGNLILHLGQATGQGVVFMAHTDELGFRVRSILPDGTLDLENKGGGSPAFYWGHPAVVHTLTGMQAGVVELPEGWDTAQFHFPADFRAPAKMYVGADSPEAVSKLGIKVGDTVTIPKHFSHLLGQRVSIRSLDDRVGCAAMIEAVWALGPGFQRNVTFVWSTREELGLEGATDYAAEAFAAGKTPSTVFAIDTFVSSDSPIESRRFADAELGNGFVIRAVDNSNIAPWPLVQRVRDIAQRNHIPVQYGITGGGNDGAAFQRYGSVDVPLSWPLRYSHSPAELIDLNDLDSLTSATIALARDW